MLKPLNAIAFAALLAVSLTALAQVAIAPIKDRINDRAGVLSAADTRDLELLLRDFERENDVPIAVVIVSTTRPEGIELYATRALAQWRNAAADGGVLLLVSKDEERLRVAALGRALPALAVQPEVDQAIAPYFKGAAEPAPAHITSRSFYGGIVAGVGKLYKTITPKSAYSSVATPAKRPAIESDGTPGGRGIFFLVVMVVLFGIVAYVLVFLKPRASVEQAFQEARIEREKDRLQPAPSEPDTTPVEHRYPVEFTATVAEYFRIWIVNLALTIATLGIYSAWAKVRKNRYFYSHTRVDGDVFEYRGNPVAILKGRLIAVGAAAAFYSVREFAPTYQWMLFVAAAFLVPWLLVRSLAFNAYNTAYRNIRLHFRGTYLKCLKLIVGYGLLTIVSAGFGYAFLKLRLTEFVVRNQYYGSTQFEIGDLKKIFFAAYARAIGLGILLATALVAIGAAAAAFGLKHASLAFSTSITILTYAGYLVIYGYVRARITNATWNNVVIGPVRFECSLGARELISIYMVNIAAVIVTLGLAMPWAVVRTMRYRTQKTTVLVSGSLDSFSAAESTQLGAAGEEVGEMFNIDVGL